VNSNADLVPTVANGKVYVASNMQLQIFGLFPPARGQQHVAAQAPQPSQPDAITCPPEEPVAAAISGPTTSLGTSSHQFSGTVCRVDGDQLHLALRSGRSISLDIATAFTKHRQIVLSPGRTVHVRVRIDAKGIAHGERISPSHTLSPLTPADR
jgi:hypothetical protein